MVPNTWMDIWRFRIHFGSQASATLIPDSQTGLRHVHPARVGQVTSHLFWPTLQSISSISICCRRCMIPSRLTRSLIDSTESIARCRLPVPVCVQLNSQAQPTRLHAPVVEVPRRLIGTLRSAGTWRRTRLPDRRFEGQSPTQVEHDDRNRVEINVFRVPMPCCR